MLKGVLCGKTYKGHLCIANRWFFVNYSSAVDSNQVNK